MHMRDEPKLVSDLRKEGPFHNDGKKKIKSVSFHMKRGDNMHTPYHRFRM